MSKRRGPARVAGLLVVLAALLVVVAPPLGAQDEPDDENPPPDTETPAEFPAGVLASMTGPDQPELAVRSVYIELLKKKHPNVVVKFAGPFQLPANDYRVSVMFGDPKGESIRTSMRMVDGTPVGSLDAGVAGGFAEIGPIDSWQNGDGSIRMVLPPDEVPDRGSMWLSIESATGTFTSQLYPLDQFMGWTPAGELSASRRAWMAPEGVTTPDVVEVPDPPTVTTDGKIVRLTWDEPPPTLVAGAPISTFIDVVRIAPNFRSGGQAPYLVAVDHVTGTVNLMDGTQLIPATLTTDDESWLVTPLDGGEVTDRSYIEFDLEQVAEQFGIEVSMETSAIGAARSITLRDGTVIRADGVIGTLDWFTLPLRADEEAEAEAEGAPAAQKADDGGDGLPLPLLLAAGGAVVVVAGLVVVLLVRRSRRSGDRAEPPPRNEHLLDSAGPLTLGRRLEPGDAIEPRPTVDLRTRPTSSGSNLDPLFDPTAQDVAPEKPIDVPDLELFEHTGIRPVDRPEPPQRRAEAKADDLTKALFEAD